MRIRIKKSVKGGYYIERRFLLFWWESINSYGTPIDYRHIIEDFNEAHETVMSMIHGDEIVAEYKR